MILLLKITTLFLLFTTYQLNSGILIYMFILEVSGYCFFLNAVWP